MTLTDTESGLRRAICHDPADDAPRIVMADWLDEDGQVERAEFIRCQIELAAIRCDRCSGDGYHRYKDFDDGTPNYSDSAPCHKCNGCGWSDVLLGGILYRREQELLARHGEMWALYELVRPCGIEVGGPRRWLTYDGISDRSDPHYQWRQHGERKSWLYCWQWTRGFISHVTVPRLADLLGEPCGRCEGDGVAAPYTDSPCPNCHGTGHIGGIAAEMFGAQSVTEVTVGDKRPVRTETGVWYWIGWENYLHRENRTEDIPMEVFHQLQFEVDPWRKDDTDGRARTARGHSTADAAKSAMSSAIVTVCRQLVGLPKLEVTR